MYLPIPMQVLLASLQERVIPCKHYRISCLQRMGYIIQGLLYRLQAAIRLFPCIGRSMMKVEILQDLLEEEFIRQVLSINWTALE